MGVLIRRATLPLSDVVSDSLTDRVITDNPLQGKVLATVRGNVQKMFKFQIFWLQFVHTSSVALSVNDSGT